MRRWIVLLTGFSLVAVGFAANPARASQSDDVEVRVLQLINQGRSGQSKGAEVTHGGLRGAARSHSADMSARDTMDHSGYPGRINTAAPDPYESNGPPDDGFNGASCENVAWYQPGGTATTEQVAQTFYSLWYNSPEHYQCMFDTYGWNLNVAGVGIYYAAGKWWATFDSAFDRTPPTASPPPTPSPAPSSPPPSGTWKRVQQNGGGVSLAGTWRSVASSYASGGSYLRSNTTSSAAKLGFTGTGVKWIGLVSTTGGIATVKLDGATVGSVDQYSASTGFGRTMFQRTGLSSGAHTLQIVVSGSRNAKATDQRTFVDAFDYFS
jgi:uncharacterized protein YkwD